MINIAPTCPRSNYPDFKKKYFDYSRDLNIEAYLKTSSRLGVNAFAFGPDKMEPARIQNLLDKISSSQNIHEITVYSDQLWDAYNSYEEIVQMIKENLLNASREKATKFLLLLKYLKADTGQNRRPIEGKHYSEIEKDAGYFKGVSIVARQILEQNAKQKIRQPALFTRLFQLFKK